MQNRSIGRFGTVAIALCLTLASLEFVSAAGKPTNPGNSANKNNGSNAGTTSESNKSTGSSNAPAAGKSSDSGSSTETKSNSASGKSTDSGKPEVPGKAKGNGSQSKAENIEDAVTAEDLECGTTANVTTSKGKSQGKKPAAAAVKTTTAEPCSTYIVVFTPGASASDRSNAIAATKSKVVREFTNVFKGALISGPASKIAALAKNPNVKYLEADAEVKTSAVQSSSPWGLDRVDQRFLPLSSTFDDGSNSAAGVKVYVVDTGINTSHGELAGRIAPGYSAIAGGIEDCNGHGSHVSGIIAGTTYGVSKSATIVPIRVLDCAGSGSYSSVIAGLDWIAANNAAGVSAVVNMSLGGPASSTLDSAVKNLITRGITVVVAAGNSNTDACTTSPARVAEAVTVGATTNQDSRATYSNFGTCLDVFAPGSAITSSWTGSSSAINTISGTSMAAPHVAGVIARFIAANPTLAPSQIASSLATAATPNVVTSAGSGSANRLVFLDFTSDGSTVTQPVEVPRTVAPGNSGTGTKKPTKKR